MLKLCSSAFNIGPTDAGTFAQSHSIEKPGQRCLAKATVLLGAFKPLIHASSNADFPVVQTLAWLGHAMYCVNAQLPGQCVLRLSIKEQTAPDDDASLVDSAGTVRRYTTATAQVFAGTKRRGGRHCALSLPLSPFRCQPIIVSPRQQGFSRDRATWHGPCNRECEPKQKLTNPNQPPQGVSSC